jgi:hypothetical protein
MHFTKTLKNTLLAGALTAGMFGFSAPAYAGGGGGKDCVKPAHKVVKVDKSGLETVIMLTKDADVTKKAGKKAYQTTLAPGEYLRVNTNATPLVKTYLPTNRNTDEEIRAFADKKITYEEIVANGGRLDGIYNMKVYTGLDKDGKPTTVCDSAAFEVDVTSCVPCPVVPAVPQETIDVTPKDPCGSKWHALLHPFKCEDGKTYVKPAKPAKPVKEIVEPLPVRPATWTITGGIGQFNNPIESTVIQQTKSGPKPAHFETAYAGTKLHGKAERATPNTAVSVFGALAQGTASLDDYTRQFCDENVKAFSLGAELEHSFFNWPVKPGFYFGAEHKNVQFGTSDYFGRTAVTMENSNNTVFGGLQLQFGKRNGSYLSLRGGMMQQDMTFARPYLSDSNEARGDGVTEQSILLEAKGQAFSHDGKWRFYGDVRSMQPKESRSTNPAERLKESTAFNARGGIEYNFENGMFAGIEAQTHREDATFVNGGEFNSSSTAAMINFGFRK